MFYGVGGCGKCISKDGEIWFEGGVEMSSVCNGWVWVDVLYCGFYWYIYNSLFVFLCVY